MYCPGPPPFVHLRKIVLKIQYWAHLLWCCILTGFPLSLPPRFPPSLRHLLSPDARAISNRRKTNPSFSVTYGATALFPCYPSKRSFRYRDKNADAVMCFRNAAIILPRKSRILCLDFSSECCAVNYTTQNGFQGWWRLFKRILIKLQSNCTSVQ